MKLIIDITQDCYDYWCEKKGEYSIADALISGTPVSTEGDLISRKALKYKNLAEVNGRLTYVLTAEEIDNAPTVSWRDQMKEHFREAAKNGGDVFRLHEIEAILDGEVLE